MCLSNAQEARLGSEWAWSASVVVIRFKMRAALQGEDGFVPLRWKVYRRCADRTVAYVALGSFVFREGSALGEQRGCPTRVQEHHRLAGRKSPCSDERQQAGQSLPGVHRVGQHPLGPRQ